MELQLLGGSRKGTPTPSELSWRLGKLDFENLRPGPCEMEKEILDGFTPPIPIRPSERNGRSDLKPPTPLSNWASHTRNSFIFRADVYLEFNEGGRHVCHTPLARIPSFIFATSSLFLWMIINNRRGTKSFFPRTWGNFPVPPGRGSCFFGSFNSQEKPLPKRNPSLTTAGGSRSLFTIAPPPNRYPFFSDKSSHNVSLILLYDCRTADQIDEETSSGEVPP